MPKEIAASSGIYHGSFFFNMPKILEMSLNDGIDPGTKNEVDGGWLNTCANTDFKEVYPDGRAPRNKIKPKWKEGERFNPEGQYLQEFKVAQNLKKGLHVLKIEHIWSKDIDSGGDDFNHLYSIWVR